MTAAFGVLLKSDLEDLQRDLLKEAQEGRLSSTDVRDILSHVSNLHFPGLITLLALGAQTTDQDSQTPTFPLTHKHITDALNHLGYTYAEKGIQLDEAEVLIKKALALKPDNGHALGPDRPSVPGSFPDRVSAWVVRPRHL
ncbi:MAG: hypothetical protein HP494_01570 [Nitrospira sp.]|nr:hypothetical protein [Nitrospira sp.]